MNVAVGLIMQETCSFNRVPTVFKDFEDGGLAVGEEVLKTSGRGMPAAFVETYTAPGDDLDFSGVIYAKAMSGGPLTPATYQRLKTLWLTGLKALGPVDAVYLALHGAMAAEDMPDTEGDLLSATRQLLGPRAFIGVTLDHHANVTRAMVAAADVMVGYETQPHDPLADARKTARVMRQIRARGRSPHAALIKVPMLAPQDRFLTSGGPMKDWFDLAREIERDPAVQVASVFPTQPWLDVPDNGWSCLVYADDPDTARRHAATLARRVWALREQFWRSDRLSVTDAVRAANAATRGVVILSDTGDAAPGGAPGDNMTLVAEMLKQGLRGPAWVPVVDPAALAAAWQHGAGQDATLQVGGIMSAGFSPQLTLNGRVAALAEPGAQLPGANRTRTRGRTALFECGNLKLALMELRERLILSPLLFTRLGLDVKQAQMAVLKTGSNFQHYDDVRSALVRVDSPGASQSDLKAFAWRLRPRPLFPFEPIPDWQP